MAKILNTDDILEALEATEIPDREQLREAVLDAIDNAAAALASHFGIKKGETTWQGKAFAGACVSFYPEEFKQPCPQVIEDGDPDGDWEARKTDDP